MKATHTLTIAIVAMVLSFFISCGTTKQTTANDTKASQQTAALPHATADANTEILSINDAFAIVGGQQDTATVMSKYGYKLAKPYPVHRLDTYNRMYYKACTLPKKSAAGEYADFPKAQRKGTSSWVGLKDDLTIGVFNNKAYQNLKEQVLSAGFQLSREGFETQYTNGTYDVYFMDAYRTVRVAKAL